jgi:hypothetical protein
MGLRGVVVMNAASAAASKAVSAEGSTSMHWSVEIEAASKKPRHTE